MERDGECALEGRASGQGALDAHRLGRSPLSDHGYSYRRSLSTRCQARSAPQSPSHPASPVGSARSRPGRWEHPMAAYRRRGGAPRGRTLHSKLRLGLTGDRRRASVRILRLPRALRAGPRWQSALADRSRRHGDQAWSWGGQLPSSVRGHAHRQLGPRGPIVRRRSGQANGSDEMAGRSGRTVFVGNADRGRARRPPAGHRQPAHNGSGRTTWRPEG